MKQLALDANKRLALLLGWTNIVDVGGALLGKPTWVCDNSRSQVQIPNWAGDWKDCGPLMVKHKVFPFLDLFNVGAVLAGDLATTYSVAYVSHFASEDEAARCAVVREICNRMEARAGSPLCKPSDGSRPAP